MQTMILRVAAALLLLASAAIWPLWLPEHGWWLSLIAFCAAMIIRPIYQRKAKRGQERLHAIIEATNFMILLIAGAWMLVIAGVNEWSSFVERCTGALPLGLLAGVFALICLRDVFSLLADPPKNNKSNKKPQTSKTGKTTKTATKQVS